MELFFGRFHRIGIVATLIFLKRRTRFYLLLPSDIFLFLLLINPRVLPSLRNSRPDPVLFTTGGEREEGISHQESGYSSAGSSTPLSDPSSVPGNPTVRRGKGSARPPTKSVFCRQLVSISLGQRTTKESEQINQNPVTSLFPANLTAWGRGQGELLLRKCLWMH